MGKYSVAKRLRQAAPQGHVAAGPKMGTAYLQMYKGNCSVDVKPSEECHWNCILLTYFMLLS